MKIALMAAGTLFLLGLTVFLIQIIRIAIGIGRIVSRVEKLTDLRNWMTLIKKMGAFRQVYEKFRN